ncbi:MAG TPA: Ni/Fe hydrogenase subunit alpha [Anaeromyxobacteraceae bacterium]|jgi:F420-non-reducing hydrogenase large subunit|nr:Ni/Fe hydrogenase subunit alpha [Anaeromyxobacteraceae bacterium]
MTRRIVLDPVTRLEGHARIEIELDEAGEVADARVVIPELRGFERFCLGRAAEEMPRITAHVCGVCPAAHHIASAKALDALYGVTPPPAARKVRDLYYHLFLLEDHALHFYYLGGPDLLVGGPDALRSIAGVVARLGQEVGRRVVEARRAARGIMSEIAGRAGHPVFALPGGISRPLPAATIARAREAAPGLVDFAAYSLDLFDAAAREGAAWRAAIDDEAFQARTHYAALVGPEDEVSFTGGTLRVVDPDGRELARFAPERYEEHIAETLEPWSWVRFPYLSAKGWKGFVDGPESGVYRVGPLARINVAARMATPRAEAARARMLEALRGRPVHATLAFHWARLVEALQAAEMVERLANDPELGEADVRRIPEAAPREGVGVVEAPRGTLIHHYRTDERGLLTGVRLLVASQQNGAAMQLTVRRAAAALVRGGRAEPSALDTLEMAYRAYDPCNACASHALPGEMPMEVIVRSAGGAVVQRLSRRIDREPSE